MAEGKYTDDRGTHIPILIDYDRMPLYSKTTDRAEDRSKCEGYNKENNGKDSD
jgi:hypothetical protein